MVSTCSECGKSIGGLFNSGHWGFYKDKKYCQNCLEEKQEKKSTQSVSVKQDTFSVVCPYCNSNIMLSLKDLPSQAKLTVGICPKCKKQLEMKIPERFYFCIGCNKHFSTIKAKVEHIKSCKQVSERDFECKHCHTNFILDNLEFEELKKNGKISIGCPTCSKSNLLRLSDQRSKKDSSTEHSSIDYKNQEHPNASFQKFEEVEESKKDNETLTGYKIRCNNCYYDWDTRGAKIPAQCPSCHNSIHYSGNYSILTRYVRSKNTCCGAPAIIIMLLLLLILMI